MGERRNDKENENAFSQTQTKTQHTKTHGLNKGSAGKSVSVNAYTEKDLKSIP